MLGQTFSQGGQYYTVIGRMDSSGEVASLITSFGNSLHAGT